MRGSVHGTLGMTWVAMAVLCLVPQTDGNQGCPKEIFFNPKQSDYHLDGQPVPVWLRYFKIEPPPGVTDCTFTADEVFGANDGFVSTVYVGYVFYVNRRQETEITIHVLPGHASFNPNVVADFSFFNCSVAYESLEVIFSFVEVSSIGFHTAHPPVPPSIYDVSNEVCSGLGNIALIFVGYVELRDLSLFSSCNRPFPKVAQIALVNASLQELPTNFSTIFPGVQQLELTGNYFRTPPADFPWTTEPRYLPRNFSRVSIVQNQYTINGLFDVAPNVFKRQLVLDMNRVEDLAGFHFRGCLQGIFLQFNSIRSIGNQTFSNLTCLRILDMHANCLSEIPPFGLDSLTSLRKLALSNNTLSRVDRFHFPTMKHLLQLNLDYNRLDEIDPQAFSNLSSLQTISMKNNRLEEFPERIFKDLPELHEVVLDENPIRRFPFVLMFSLEKISILSLRSTGITSFNLTDICLMAISDFNLNLQDGSTVSDIVKHARNIDLTGSSISTVTFTLGSRGCDNRLKFTLCAFKFLLEANPLNCNTSILNFTSYWTKGIHQSDVRCTPNAPHHMVCSSPEELRGRPLFSVLPNETYGLIEDPLCPDRCRCFRRQEVLSVIVDCRGRGLSQLPQELPHSPLELWFQDNNVTSLAHRAYLPRVLTLNLSGNALQDLGPRGLEGLEKLQRLSLADNLLASLPRDVARLHLSRLELHGNPFRCDCHLLWVKDWIRRGPPGLEKRELIKCSAHDGEGQQIQLVEDEDFVCVEVDELRLGLQSGVPSGVVLLLLAAAVVCYLRHQELKVWLYVHTGWHPFDKDRAGQAAQEGDYDACVLCEKELDAWTFKEVSGRLEREWGYRVFHLWRDVGLGEALHESAARAAGRSLRLVVVLETESAPRAWLGAALQQSLAPGRQRSPHFVVLLLHGEPRPPFPGLHPQLQRYVKARRYVNARAPRMFSRLMYHMPQKPLRRNSHAVVVNPPPDVPVEADADHAVHPKELRHCHENDHCAVFDAAVVENGIQERWNDPYLTKDLEETKSTALLFTECSNGSVGNSACVQELSPENVNVSLVHKSHVVDHRPYKSHGEPQYRGTLRNPSFEGAEAVPENQAVPVVQNPTPQEYLSIIDMGALATETTAHGAECSGEECPDCMDLPVFVWYESADFPFLMERVVAPLSRLGVRFLLEDKDFLPGVAKSQNLLQAVAASRCSLLVLSAASLPNEWLLYAYQVALEQHLARRRHKVALLMRRDCPLAALDEELKQALAATAVLEEDGPWFESNLFSLILTEAPHSDTTAQLNGQP